MEYELSSDTIEPRPYWARLHSLLSEAAFLNMTFEEREKAARNERLDRNIKLIEAQKRGPRMTLKEYLKGTVAM